MSKHILVLGATGPTGLLFCQDALAAGHNLTLLVRTPSKVPQAIATNPKVIVVEGQLTQEERLKDAVSRGATILVSFLGPGPGHKGTPLTEGYKKIIPLCIERRFERIIILCTASWVAPEDKVSLKWKLMAGAAWAFAGSAYTDLRALGDYVHALSPSEVGWTMFRVPMLNDQPAAKVNAAYLGSPSPGIKLSRGSMTKWILQEIEEAKWREKAPCLWNCKCQAPRCT